MYAKPSILYDKKNNLILLIGANIVTNINKKSFSEHNKFIMFSMMNILTMNVPKIFSYTSHVLNLFAAIVKFCCCY